MLVFPQFVLTLKIILYRKRLKIFNEVVILGGLGVFGELEFYIRVVPCFMQKLCDRKMKFDLYNLCLALLVLINQNFSEL